MIARYGWLSLSLLSLAGCAATPELMYRPPIEQGILFLPEDMSGLLGLNLTEMRTRLGTESFQNPFNRKQFIYWAGSGPQGQVQPGMACIIDFDENDRIISVRYDRFDEPKHLIYVADGADLSDQSTTDGTAQSDRPG